MADDPQGFPLVRIPTGIAGLDTILGGGLFKGGIYIASGVPGAGKTIFANQVCLNWAREGRRALYVTLLAETHARMLAQVRSLSFFDESKVGSEVKYVNGFKAIETEGLEGLLKLLRSAIREHHADLLVLDGMVTASSMAPSAVDYKKFINELQTWVGMLGCTVLFLTSTSVGAEIRPEHTMVDGIFELFRKEVGVTVNRLLRVSKFRASGFIEGWHTYTITGDGLTVYPRLEAWATTTPPGRPNLPPVSSGVKGFDKVLGGGLPGASTTLLLGPSGCGKTMLGMQFLIAGLEEGASVVHFSLFERPDDVIQRYELLGLKKTRQLIDEGRLVVQWRRPAELLLDEVGYGLLGAVETSHATRVFIDGLAGIKSITDPNRFPGFFSALADALAARGATLVISEETRELMVQEVEIPTQGVSAIFQNIIFMRNVEVDGRLHRVLAVMKTRDTPADRSPYDYEITQHGLKVLKPRRGTGAMMTRGHGKGSRRKLLKTRLR